MFGKDNEMTHSNDTPPNEYDQTPHVAMRELTGAQADLTQLSAILKDAFGELFGSFNGVQTAAREAGILAAMDGHASRAITALQCEDLAIQLIRHTHKRLNLARDSLKIYSQMPQTCLTSADLAPATGLIGTSTTDTPVQQQAMQSGSIELF